uniref:Flavin-containing monooxygenase n=1 Tax=Romanomermis culicivorax TaxID=13658 RepID=A0A915IHY5_ROMCU
DSSCLTIDDVIFCTGYTSGLSVLNESISQECQSIGLYKLMYPVHGAGRSAQHNTLCFVGQTAQRGATLPIAEMQARYHCAVLDKRIRLPSYENMQKEMTRYSGSDPAFAVKYFFMAAVPYQFRLQ